MNNFKSSRAVKVNLPSVIHWTDPGWIQKILSQNGDRPLNSPISNTAEFSGWLRKPGGPFKQWKRRFFVLEKGRLDYYSMEDRQRLQGSFSIDNPPVEVISCETDVTSDDKSFQFLLKRSDEVSSSTMEPGSKTQLLLSASSANERKSWLRAIRKQLFIRKGGGLFGTHLSEIFRYTSPDTKFVPRVVYEAAEFIRKYGLDAEGIFRKCGSKHTLMEVSDAYDSGKPSPILIQGVYDVHLAAGLLKQYLCELPEPVIPYRQYDRLKATGFYIEDGQSLQPIIDQLETLPAPNYNLLQYICQLLYEVSEHREKNLMPIENLATMFAPSILRPADEDPDVEMSATAVITLTVGGFIRCHDQLFTRELLPLTQLQSAAAACPAESIRVPLTTSSARQAAASLEWLQQKVQAGQLYKTLTSSIPFKKLVPKLVIKQNNHKHNFGDNLEAEDDEEESSPHFWFPHEANQKKLRHSTTISTRDSTSEDTSRPSLPISTLIPPDESCDRSMNQKLPGVSSDSLESRVETRSCKSLQSPTPSTSAYQEESFPDSFSLNSTNLLEELRQWKSQALVARAQAACDRAKAESLNAELARTRCDLNMAEMELGLMRKRLAALEKKNTSHHPIQVSHRCGVVFPDSIGDGADSG